MREKLLALSGAYEMLPGGELVLCAVSGGADSMSLLHLLRALSGEAGFSLHAAHFNHHLRGAESDRDEAFVRARCRDWGVPLTCGGGDVAQEARQSGRGIEETARALRYAFLEQTADALGAARIATAHTADDNAETLLLHLVRGSGLAGLTGIPPRRGRIVRPLLTTTRREIEAYCAAQGIPYVTDSTNADAAYARNFLRLRVLPLLKELNPQAVEHISAAAGLLRLDNDYLTARAQAVADQGRRRGGGIVIPAETLAQQPDPVASRAAFLLLERSGGGQNRAAAHSRAILALCRGGSPSAQVDLPGVTARREYDLLSLTPAGPGPELPAGVPVREGERTVWGGWQVTCRAAVCPERSAPAPGRFYLSPARLQGQLTLRTRRVGDRLKLPGRGTKTLKKLYIEAKVPAHCRGLLPVLADDDGVAAAIPFGPHAAKLAHQGERALEIIIIQKEGERWHTEKQTWRGSCFPSSS
jgi:tRNA(Ile)-lysidine synthase